MVKLLIVSLKKPSSVDVVKPLRNVFEDALNTVSKAENYAAVSEFGKLRDLVVSKFTEKTESSLECIYRYYDEICTLESKVPTGELQIPFKWRDAFDKGNIFGEKVAMTHTTLSYEKVCVLFNIAAIQSALASQQTLEADNELKVAMKYLQQAAGIFEDLKGLISANFPLELTPDLQNDTLSILETLMLAQAQELFIKKAIRDHLKDGVIAALCSQCEEFYATLLKGMQSKSTKVAWEKDWLQTVSAKQMAYHAMSQLFQSFICRSNKQIGEEIARLKDSVYYFQSCQSVTNDFEFVHDYASRATLSLEEAIRDNNFIYNEIIPDSKFLSKPANVQLAKPIPTTTPLSKEFKSLFKDFIPIQVQKAISASETRKNEAVNNEITKLRESTKELNELLSSLNLPAAIETTPSGCGLPPSITAKAEDVRQKGGIQRIETLLKELPELLTRNREILDETENILKEEQTSDDLLRTQFKERWSRVPSSKLNGAFLSNMRKYREILKNAIDADKIIRQKYEENKQIIALLSYSPEEIERFLPSVNETNVLNESTVLCLQKLMKKVDEIKIKRDAIEAELKLVQINLESEFFQSFAQDGIINEVSLSTSTINETLNPLRTDVQQSLKDQKELTFEIQKAHSEFKNLIGTSNDARDKFLSDLSLGYDHFVQLECNLKEGIKFYNDLTQLLVVFQNKVADFSFARKTEKDELMKDVTKELSQTLPDMTNSDLSLHGDTSLPQQGNLPYPTHLTSFPMPIGSSSAAPYSTYVAPPMPSGFNPYATLPYPTTEYDYQGIPRNPK